MELSKTAQPSQPISRLATLVVELSNARVDRGDRPRNRTETYTLGISHGADAQGFTPSYDMFSFCCYRAMLLGSPAVIIGAVGPAGRLLTEPIPPQRLAGEDTVEAREWSKRMALLFRMQTGCGKYSIRRVFSYRNSHGKGRQEWLVYQPSEVILDGTTEAPPTFTDVDDFRNRSQILARGGPLTKAQAWSTWFWLLLHKTYHGTKSSGQYTLASWHSEYGITYRWPTLMKKGW